MLNRCGEIPDEPLGGAVGLEKSSTPSTSGSDSSTSSDSESDDSEESSTSSGSESDDSEAERVRKITHLQEQVSLERMHMQARSYCIQLLNCIAAELYSPEWQVFATIVMNRDWPELCYD
jgi:hypothetical protein